MTALRREQQLAEYLLNMPLCIFCSSFHKSENCDKVVETVKRIEILMKKQLCLVCISHHVSLECPRTTVICGMCNELNHHVAICYINDVLLKDKKDEE